MSEFMENNAICSAPVLSENDAQISIAVKAALALMNGKRESLSREFYNRIVVTLDSIIELDRLVCEKLQTENLVAATTTIDVKLDKGRRVSFTTANEMQKYQWRTESKSVRTILIKWDFFIKLPNYTSPQRHTLSLRLMDIDIPGFIYDLGVIEDEGASIFMSPTAICRIDFINSIIAEELTQIIDRWIENIEDNDEPKLRNWTRKHVRSICNVAYWTGFVMVPLLACYLAKRFCIFDSFESWGIVLLAAILVIPQIATSLGSFANKMINKKVMGYWRNHAFSITTGDGKEQKVIEKRRSSKKEWILFVVNLLISVLLTVLTLQ